MWEALSPAAIRPGNNTVANWAIVFLLLVQSLYVFDKAFVL
jgi:hypothetical protein